MVKFEDLRQQIDITDIKKVQRETGVLLPDPYTRHLLSYNGGHPIPDIFPFVDKGKKTNSRIQIFFAIGTGEYDDLYEAIQVLKIDEKRMPSHIIPIAEDPFGNMVTISAADWDYGKIYFWDHEREVDYRRSNDLDYSNLYLISNSLQSLLEELTDEIIE
ncbi:MAG: SMI1/KNR4 family protein [Candidatus Kapaibacterium sp.]